MNDFWNERYGAPEFAYGEAPNNWLEQELPDVPPGQTQRILLPAEGEGRNAVFAAKKGYTVVCFDASEKGREKAMQLAERHGVVIDYRINDAMHFQIEPGAYDVVALIYAHFPADLLPIIHARCVEALRPGGHFILEGFAKEQLPLNSGGPKNEAMLFSIDELSQQLAGLRTLDLRRERVLLNEGAFHQGEAEVIRATGLK
jgi:SAM-dependent methyltransferase